MEPDLFSMNARKSNTHHYNGTMYIYECLCKKESTTFIRAKQKPSPSPRDSKRTLYVCSELSYSLPSVHRIFQTIEHNHPCVIVAGSIIFVHTYRTSCWIIFTIQIKITHGYNRYYNICIKRTHTHS